MNRTWLAGLLLFSLAQEPTPEQIQANNAARAAQAKALDDAMRNGQKGLFDNFPNPDRSVPIATPSYSGPWLSPKDRSLQQFRAAIPKFRDATSQYRVVLGQDGKLDKPLRLLQAQIDVLLRLLKESKIRHEGQDSDEFKGYSKAELQWEALNTAEHIDAILDLIAMSQGEDVLSLKMQERRYNFYGELLRLKWLASRIL